MRLLTAWIRGTWVDAYVLLRFMGSNIGEEIRSDFPGLTDSATNGSVHDDALGAYRWLAAVSTVPGYHVHSVLDRNYRGRIVWGY